MSAYLFVHFRETTTPDGEQVYFALSKDGFAWEAVNESRPVLWAYYGDMGVRDFTICRSRDSKKFWIVATDLSLSYGMRGKYHHSWKEIGENGSKNFAVWESDDLVSWSEEKLVKVGDEAFGCMWAPDVLYDEKTGDYLLHWSSSHASDGYELKKIYYSRTKDFETFSKPEVLLELPGKDIIDSAMYEENGYYYLFIKCSRDPGRIMEFRSSNITGPFEKIPAFDESMLVLEEGLYEAPTAVKLDDGRWCLFLDFYGVKGAGQGYVPFVSDDLGSGIFTRSDAKFSFPYGFKHGTILKITDEEYERIASHTGSFCRIEDGR